MFDKEKFSSKLNEINNTYNNMTEFAKKANFDRSYISKYIHKRLSNPPSPKILERIANASNGKTRYEELMQICGYTNYMYTFFFDDAVHQLEDGRIPIIREISYITEKKAFEFYFSGSEYINSNFELDNNKEYFAYKTQDDSMLPLLGIGDIAIIEKTNDYKNGNTCLISLDNKLILIRKIIKFDDYIELHTAFPYSQPIKITNEEKEARNFTILGKVIKAENQSAFK